MKKPITLSIKSEQLIDDEKSEIEFMTSGKMHFKDDCCIIEYLEADDEGQNNINTTLSINKNKVVVTRGGSYSSFLVLESGKRHLCPYTTPAGMMTLGISTHTLNNEITASGGKMLVDYDIEFNHVTSSYNKFELTVWETK